MYRTLVVVYLFLASSLLLAEAKTIAPNSASIAYTGRYAFTTIGGSQAVQFDWAGFQISTVVSGTSSVSATLSQKSGSEGNVFGVFVDGILRNNITVTTTKTNFVLASGLTTTQSHTILLFKRTEALFESVYFYGFDIQDAGSVSLPVKVSSRKIEFIGDSITSGYGNEGENPNCAFSARTENNYLAWGALIARSLQAEYFAHSWSGRGMVRNYGDANTASAEPLPKLYPRTFASAADSPAWDFTRWVPDVVVINLGTNDFSTAPGAVPTVFQNTYVEFIRNLSRLYSSNPNLTFFVSCGPLMNGDAECGYVQNVINALPDKKVYLLSMRHILNNPADLGCSYHPNIGGHKKMHDIAYPRIRDIMGWNPITTPSSSNVASTTATPSSSTVAPSSTGSSNAICFEANEFTAPTISCTNGQVISINNALYGTPSDCPNIAAGSCNNASALSIVRGLCQGKTSCSIVVQNTVFGEPCFNIVKHLAVSYQCVNAVTATTVVPSTSSSTVAPSTSTRATTATTATPSTSSSSTTRAPSTTATPSSSTVAPSSTGSSGAICFESNEFTAPTISCSNGQVISINNALYGTPSDCPNIAAGSCNNASALSIVRGLCQGKTSCSIVVQNTVFGEPCFNVAKHLAVSYQCVNPAPPSTASYCAEIGEWSPATLSCTGGKTVSVVTAFYGTPTGCPSPAAGTCGLSTLSTAKSLCDGKTSCQVWATNANFGISDPCPNIQKKFAASYNCI